MLCTFYSTPWLYNQQLTIPLGSLPTPLSIHAVHTQLTASSNAVGWLWTYLQPSRVSGIGFRMDLWNLVRTTRKKEPLYAMTPACFGGAHLRTLAHFKAKGDDKGSRIYLFSVRCLTVRPIRTVPQPCCCFACQITLSMCTVTYNTDSYLRILRFLNLQPHQRRKPIYQDNCGSCCLLWGPFILSWL